MAILKLVGVGERVWAWGMGIKELPLSLQVETGIPRAALCLLAGHFSLPLVPITASKDGGGLGGPREACLPNPGEPRDLFWSGTGIQPREGGMWEVWQLQVPSGLLILALFVLGFLLSMA